MTRPLRKTKNFSIITVFTILTIVLCCITTACTSPNVETPAPTPDEVTKRIETSDVETPIDKTLPEETPVVPEEQAIPEEVLQALQKYAINNEKSFEYLESEDYFGDRIQYYFGDDITLYGIFESDLSLKELGTKTYDFNSPVEITEDEAKTIIHDYTKKYWPHMEAGITKYEYHEGDLSKSFWVDGVLINPSNQSEQKFWASVNGKGELTGICRVPEINIEQCIANGTALTLDQAKELAYQHLNEYNPIIDINNIKTVSEKLDDSYEVYTFPIYIFEFEYRSDNPTIKDFDYDADVAIKPSNGDHSGIGLYPITDNIDVVPFEEAEQIAIEYVVTNYGQELEDISTSYKDITVSLGEILYSFCFDWCLKTSRSMYL